MSTATNKRTPLPGASNKPKRAKKKMGRPRGTTNKMFGLPVEDADKGITMPLLQVDIEEASKVKADDVNEKGNFLGCVIAQTTTRVCGAERAAILRNTAFIAYPGENKVRRYMIDGRSRQVLEAWDRGEPVVEGVELRLRAPGKAETRDAQRKQSRRWRSRHPELKSRERKTERKQRPKDPLHDIVRNGNLVRWS